MWGISFHMVGLGLYRDNGKENETTIIYWGYIGIMEKKMETTILYYGGISLWLSIVKFDAW